MSDIEIKLTDDQVESVLALVSTALYLSTKAFDLYEVMRKQNPDIPEIKELEEIRAKLRGLSDL
jgi:hypothetical protein